MNSPIPHILLIDDDPILGEQLSSLLRQQGYRTTHCLDGESGLAFIRSGHAVHLLLLDVHLPGMDGLSVLAELRQQAALPVLILSARGAEEERISGLQNGADDYLAKPFNSLELLLRIEALLRRTAYLLFAPVHTTQLILDSLSLNSVTAEITVSDQPVELTPLQFRLLWILVSHRGQILSKSYLYHTLFQREYSLYDRSLDMHVSRIRRKLSVVGFDALRLRTQHGKGYCLQ